MVRATAEAQAQAEQAVKRGRLLGLLSQLWAWVFLILLVAFFSTLAPSFLSLFNIQSILANIAIMLIMALGQTFVIIAAGIDLSTGYVMGLASVIAALVMTRLGGSWPLGFVVLSGLAVGLAAGILAGAINGLVITRLNVPPFIATLGMFGIARGFGFIFSGGQPVSVHLSNLGQVGNGYLLYYYPGKGVSFFHPPTGIEGAALRQVLGILPHPVTLAIVLVLLCHALLRFTRFGLRTYAIGGNREAAIRAGIPVASHTVLLYILSAGLAAIAGVLYVTRFTNGAANAGDALLLDSIAAVVIGGASLFGGEGTIFGTVVGSLIIAVLQNGLVILGVNPFWQFVAVGVVIILAVLVDQAKAKIVR